MNILFVTLDQFRADCLSCAGHPLVRTPALDALASQGVRFGSHYTQATPCAPGRAALYTGTYQMNNRVVANGSPLDSRFDNVAKAARRAGYDPVLFGYTDQTIDPRDSRGPGDPRLHTLSGVLPGFRTELSVPDGLAAWLDYLRAEAGVEFTDPEHALATEPSRPSELGLSAFLTDGVIEWLRGQSADRPWFAHVSHLRPHPPYAAAGSFAAMYDPADVTLPITASDERHPVHDEFMAHPDWGCPVDEVEQRRMRAQYFGMISDVDAQLARVWAALDELGMWEDTFVVVTADHADQLGDHGLIQKSGWFEECHHIVGIIRDPRHRETHGTTIERFTESVDVFPTICEAMGIAVPAQCDGLPLTPFLEGMEPPSWRSAAHWEFDWRDEHIDAMRRSSPRDRSLEEYHLAVLRDDRGAYVQFGDGTWMLYDLAVDATWRTRSHDPARVLDYAQRMLVWRSRHTDRTHTGFLAYDGGIGRWPDPVTHFDPPAP